MSERHSAAGGPAVPPARRSVGGGATLATFAQVFAVLGGGLAGVVVARVLGPADTGSFNLLLSLLLILLVIAPLGLEYGVSYYVGRGDWNQRDALRQLTGAACVLGIAGALSGLAVVTIGSGHLFPGIDVVVAAVGLAAAPFGIAWTLGSYLALAGDRYETFAIAPAIQAVSLLVAALALVPPLGLGGAAIALLLSNAIAASATWLLNRRATGRAATGWLSRARHDLARGIRFGLPGTATNTLGTLVQRADLFVVSAVASRATTGYYAIALSLAAVQAVLPRALASVVFPRVSSLGAGEDRDQEEMVLVKAVRHGALLAVASGVAVAVGALAVPFVYGEEFRDAIPFIWILVPGGSAYGLAAVLSAIVLGKGRPGLLLRGSLVVTPPSLALFVLAGATIGATGVAIASTVAYIALMLVAAYYFMQVAHVRHWRVLLPGREELADYAALARRGLGHLPV